MSGAKYPLVPASTTRENGVFYTDSGPFTLDVTLTSVKRQVTIYCWCWDGSGKSLQIEVLDGDTGSALDTQTVTDYANGKYFVWLVTGHVKFRLTGISSRPFASALFFDTTVPTITNVGARNHQTNAVDLVGSLVSAGATATTTYLYWATNDCTTNASAWIAGGGVSNLGSYAQGATFTNTLAGLSANTLYYLNHAASNSFGTDWAAAGGSPSFRTLGGTPAVNNGTGARPLITSANLTGTLTGGGVANVVIALWADGSGTTNLLDFGFPVGEGSFATNVTGLTGGTTYHYQCYASNAYGTAWADTSTNFTTYAANNPATGNVIWSGGAGGGLREWCFDANWRGGRSPANPTTGSIVYTNVGTNVTGILEENRQVGGISLGTTYEAGTTTHTLDLGGYALTLAGPLAGNMGTRTLVLQNGTFLVGTASTEGSLTVGNSAYGTVILRCAPGVVFNSVRLGTLRVGSASDGSNAQGAQFDLRGATAAGGILVVKSLTMGAKGTCALMLDANTVLESIVISNTLSMGESGYGGTAYIGNPSNSRLPPNISLRIGAPAARASVIQIGKNGAPAQALTATLAASSGGSFTAYVTNLTVVPYEASYTGNAQQDGMLDLSGMTNCTIDAINFFVARDYANNNASAQPRGIVRLCSGTVTAGTVVVGSANTAGFGLLALSNTLFTVTNSFTLNTTATNLISLGAIPAGLDVQGTFADGGGKIRISFLADAGAGTTNWAVRIKGDAQSTLNSMLGSGRVSSTGTYAGRKAGVLYDGAYTYYAMADSNAFTTLPIAAAYASRTYEIAPAGTVVIGTNDINNGSSDPNSRPLTMTIYTNGGPEGATLTFNAVGDYPTTLKVTAGSDSATATCTVHVVNLNPGVTNDVTWVGSASTLLMDRREWWWSGNWQEGVPPTNPTTARLLYKTPGQSVRGIVEQPRTIGGIRIGQSDSTPITHTLDLGGTVLTLAGDLDNTILANATFALTNGTLRIGSDTIEGNLSVGNSEYGGAALLCRAGTVIDTRRVGTLRAGTATGASNAQSGQVDLRKAAIVGGVLAVRNIVVGANGSASPSYIALDGTTTISAIAVSNSLVIGESSYGGTAYIGNPADAGKRLPANVDIRVGAGPTARASIIQIGKNTTAGQALTATLATSTGGTFTAYVTNLTVVPYEAGYTGNATQDGTLDLSGMTNCTIDAINFMVAADYAGNNPSAQPRGTVRLCPGAVTLGTGVIGATNNAGFGRLVLSNTTFTVTNLITINKTGQMTVNVGSQSSGLVISNAADTAFSMDTATNGALRIVFRAKATSSPFYGLAWAGDHVTAMQGLQADGKLVVDSTGLAPKTAEIFKSGGFTYVGVPLPSGSSFVFR